MEAKRETNGQYDLENYSLKKVEVRLRMEEVGKLYSQTPISSPGSAVRIMRRELSQLDREYLCVVNLDNRLHALNFNVVSIGTINQTFAQGKEIFKSAVLINAANIMLFHNHPSGDVSPSMEDTAMTKTIADLGRMMGIKVIDHIIVGGGNENYYSFKEQKPDLLDTKKADDLAAEPYSVENSFFKCKKSIESLADEINDFLLSSNRIEYENTFLGKQDGFSQIKKLLQKDPVSIIKWLENYRPASNFLIKEVASSKEKEKPSVLKKLHEKAADVNGSNEAVKKKRDISYER